MYHNHTRVYRGHNPFIRLSPIAKLHFPVAVLNAMDKVVAKNLKYLGTHLYAATFEAHSVNGRDYGHGIALYQEEGGYLETRETGGALRIYALNRTLEGVHPIDRKPADFPELWGDLECPNDRDYLLGSQMVVDIIGSLVPHQHPVYSISCGGIDRQQPLAFLDVEMRDARVGPYAIEWEFVRADKAINNSMSWIRGVRDPR